MRVSVLALVRAPGACCYGTKLASLCHVNAGCYLCADCLSCWFAGGGGAAGVLGVGEEQLPHGAEQGEWSHFLYCKLVT